VYVSPRLHADLQAAVDREGLADPFLEMQRATAAAVCQRLQAHAPGPRLLDVGFGGGAILRTARAYGFEVHGIDREESRDEELRERFGRRLHRTTLGDAPVTGGPFDAVVMSHVIGSLPDPVASMCQIRLAMAPGGVIYLSVPDVESVQFKILGKRWEPISPLLQHQYFNERSLPRLLERSGFTDAQRVPPIQQGPPATRWLHLVRSLGGDDTGELAVMARNPK
jgi:ubiquinone/menaquinone biosynthesis C-methylase UbiE